MIKKAFNSLFAKQTKGDYLKGLWMETLQKQRQRFSVITVTNLLDAETEPDNALLELEIKMGKTEHSFQQILANSL